MLESETPKILGPVLLGTSLILLIITALLLVKYYAKAKVRRRFFAIEVDRMVVHTEEATRELQR